MPTLSEAAIRAGSAFYETAAAAREASSRADGLAASAAAAAGAATAPLASLQALRDAVKGSAEETETALGGATVAAGDLGEAVGKAGGASAAAAPELAMPTWSRPSARRSPAAPFMAKAIARSGRGCATAACGPRRGGCDAHRVPPGGGFSGRRVDRQNACARVFSRVLLADSARKTGNPRCAQRANEGPDRRLYGQEGTDCSASGSQCPASRRDCFHSVRQSPTAEPPPINLNGSSPFFRGTRSPRSQIDNRASQNAEWDEALLGLELGDLQGDGFDLALTGFDDAGLNRLGSWRWWLKPSGRRSRSGQRRRWR